MIARHFSIAFSRSQSRYVNALALIAKTATIPTDEHPEDFDRRFHFTKRRR
jgi:hypothetical protein